MGGEVVNWLWDYYKCFEFDHQLSHCLLGESRLSPPPPSVVTRMNFSTFCFLVMGGHHILGYFPLFYVYSNIFRLKLVFF